MHRMLILTALVIWTAGVDADANRDAIRQLAPQDSSFADWRFSELERVMEQDYMSLLLARWDVYTGYAFVRAHWRRHAARSDVSPLNCGDLPRDLAIISSGLENSTDRVGYLRRVLVSKLAVGDDDVAQARFLLLAVQRLDRGHEQFQHDASQLTDACSGKVTSAADRGAKASTPFQWDSVKTSIGTAALQRFAYELQWFIGSSKSTFTYEGLMSGTMGSDDIRTLLMEYAMQLHGVPGRVDALQHLTTSVEAAAGSRSKQASAKAGETDWLSWKTAMRATHTTDDIQCVTAHRKRALSMLLVVYMYTWAHVHIENGDRMAANFWLDDLLQKPQNYVRKDRDSMMAFLRLLIGD